MDGPKAAKVSSSAFFIDAQGSANDSLFDFGRPGRITIVTVQSSS
jgi:hypothetical protein